MDLQKKRKNYFSNQRNQSKKRKRLTLECGMKGFLCTCNLRERDCIREAYNLLNEYAEKIDVTKNQHFNSSDVSLKSGVSSKNDQEIVENKDEEEVENKDEEEVENKDEEEVVESKDNKEQTDIQESKEEDVKEEQTEIQESNKITKEIVKEQTEIQESNEITKEIVKEENEDDDILTVLNKEITELKAEAVKLPSQKTFQVVDTGVQNVIFITSKIPDTLELLTVIINDLRETKKQKTRCLLRMLPIQVTCKAYINDLKAKADILFDQYFKEEPKTFCIVFNRHSNNNLHRNNVIEDLAEIILKKNPGNKANLKDPDIAVVVEVVKAICLISIAPHYFKYKKYNLIEICKQKE